MIVASPYNGTTPSIHPTAFIAKDAVIIGDVEIGAYVNIWFGAKLRGDWGKIVVGENTSIQENCVIHSTVRGLCKIGKNVTLGHLSMEYPSRRMGEWGSNLYVDNGQKFKESGFGQEIPKEFLMEE